MIKRNKKGVSIIIGYVILVAIAISMSFLVYAWMKSYLPEEKFECPADVSIRITLAECSGDRVHVKIKNNGLFDVDGYVVKGESDEGVLIDLHDGTIKFDTALSPAVDGEESVEEERYFGDGDEGVTIKSVEITPVKFQKNAEGQEQIAFCTDSVVTKPISNGDCTINI